MIIFGLFTQTWLLEAILVKSKKTTKRNQEEVELPKNPGPRIRARFPHLFPTEEVSENSVSGDNNPMLDGTTSSTASPAAQEVSTTHNEPSQVTTSRRKRRCVIPPRLP